MSQTLSLSLRPSTLESYIGNPGVVEAVKNQLSSRVPAAILLSGAPGVGKTTMARIIAKMVNPGEDEPSVENINGASDNGIDRIRELIEGASYCPLSGQRKVVVIDEAHQLTNSAQQALLIPTEPDKSYTTLWIFTSSNPDKMDKALRSRCVHYALKPMGEIEIRALVQRAAENTESQFDTTSFIALMVKSRVGSPREILMAWELYSSGTPLVQCVTSAEHQAEYVDIARAVVKGDWNACRTLLSQIPTADSRALRSIVSGFLRSALIKTEPGTKAAALATCVVGMGSSSFEDGLSWSATVGLFYKTCAAISGGK